jgi:hypothetical protein
MQCREDIRTAGKPYPRTCQICGIAPCPKASAPREWLIQKGSYFYRENRAGYTDKKAEAGRYTEAEAKREAAIEPSHMSAVHQDAIADDALKPEGAPMPVEAPFNGLSNAQAELLDMLAEEAAEIGVAIGKIKRHGYDSYHPNRVFKSATNRTDLEKEIGDLIGIMRRIVSNGDLNGDLIEVSAALKWVRAKKFTHHQGYDNA